MRTGTVASSINRKLGTCATNPGSGAAALAVPRRGADMERCHESPANGYRFRCALRAPLLCVFWQTLHGELCCECDYLFDVFEKNCRDWRRISIKRSVRGTWWLRIRAMEQLRRLCSFRAGLHSRKLRLFWRNCLSLKGRNRLENSMFSRFLRPIRLCSYTTYRYILGPLRPYSGRGRKEKKKTDGNLNQWPKPSSDRGFGWGNGRRQEIGKRGTGRRFCVRSSIWIHP